jgi:hypothetical protein
MNPNRRKLAEALAFPKNEFKGSSSALKILWRSSVAPNPAAEPESRKYDIICPKKKWNVV